MHDKEMLMKQGGAKLVYPFKSSGPASAEAIEVAPGVLWIRLPMPGGGLLHLNAWAIEDGDGWAIVDTGVGTPEVLAAWMALFAGPLGKHPVTRVFVTHMHPDHIGMAGWFTRELDCRLWITRLEYLNCRVLAADTGFEAPPDAITFYRRAGWDQNSLHTYRARFGSFGKFVYSMPESYRRIQDGERLVVGHHEWRVIVGNGHSPEHACLHCPELQLLISGDQVLPRISSNVSVFPTEPDANPMSDWLASLVKLEHSVPDDVLVLPAHNEPFKNLHARLAALTRSQERTLNSLRAALNEPKRAVDLFEVLFRTKVQSHDILSMATGETLACLNYLIARGEATVQADANDVFWYRET